MERCRLSAASPIRARRSSVRWFSSPYSRARNCDYDTAKAFRRAGAEVRSEVFCNLTAEAIFDSIRRMKEAIAACHIFVLCGGFSAGDEPDGRR